MALAIDTNTVIYNYLKNQSTLTDVVGTRIYRTQTTPKGMTLPALSFFNRGGTSSPIITEIHEPSVQFDCWGATTVEARQVYRALYAVLQGIENVKVTISGTDYYILYAAQEVEGQDLEEGDMTEGQRWFRCLTFFTFLIR